MVPLGCLYKQPHRSTEKALPPFLLAQLWPVSFFFVGKSKRSGQTQSVHDINGRVVGTEDVGAAAFGSFTFAGKLLT
jgi:hypothetical protein